MRKRSSSAPLEIRIICLPAFNALATLAFIDPLRAANYLSGRALFRWKLLSTEPALRASNNATLACAPLASGELAGADWIIVSSSWNPEAFHGTPLLRQIKTAASRAAFVGALDTGGFILAEAGLLKGRRATVHYEHIDGFQERFPDTTVVEDLFVIDGNRGTCCGGTASIDFALHLLRATAGTALANAAARYLLHDRIRRPDSRQKPRRDEPAGFQLPAALGRAIDLMEQNLETPLPIPVIAERLGISQRAIARMFREHTRSSPVRYYANARLDRARALLTQTPLTITEIALASGFRSPEHFSRAYRRRFSTAPRQDRINARVPFEYRAWPMHSVIRSD